MAIKLVEVERRGLLRRKSTKERVLEPGKPEIVFAGRRGNSTVIKTFQTTGSGNGELSTQTISPEQDSNFITTQAIDQLPVRLSRKSQLVYFIPEDATR